jgi:flagellin
MSLNIRNNLMALSAQRHLSQTYRTLSESITRLASGLRINTSDDDAAGMAVRELLRADVKAYGQGIRNAADAQSMLWVFDGACQVIDEKLIRMKELAMQSATGSYSDDQRPLIASEFNEMANELNRIAVSTEFNGVYGLTSAGGSIKIHVGKHNDPAGDYYYIQLDDLRGSALGLVTKAGPISIGSQASAQAALDVIDSAIVAKDNARAGFGSMINRLTNTVANLEIMRENVQAAESQLSDADVAWEMAELVRNQVLAQAGVSMLAQANAVPMMALTLLAGL